MIIIIDRPWWQSGFSRQQFSTYFNVYQNKLLSKAHALLTSCGYILKIIYKLENLKWLKFNIFRLYAPCDPPYSSSPTRTISSFGIRMHLKLSMEPFFLLCHFAKIYHSSFKQTRLIFVFQSLLCIRLFTHSYNYKRIIFFK